MQHDLHLPSGWTDDGGWKFEYTTRTLQRPRLLFFSRARTDGWTDGQFNYFLEMDIIQELFPLFMYSNDKLMVQKPEVRKYVTSYI